MGGKTTPKKSITSIKEESEAQILNTRDQGRYSLRSSSQTTPIQSPHKKAILASPAKDLNSPGPRTRSQNTSIKSPQKKAVLASPADLDSPGPRKRSQNTPIKSPQKKAVLTSPAEDVDSPGPRTRSQNTSIKSPQKKAVLASPADLDSPGPRKRSQNTPIKSPQKKAVLASPAEDLNSPGPKTRSQNTSIKSPQKKAVLASPADLDSPGPRKRSQNTPIKSPQKKAVLASPAEDVDSPGPRTRSQNTSIKSPQKKAVLASPADLDSPGPRKRSQNTPIKSPQKKAVLASPAEDVDSPGPRTRSQNTSIKSPQKKAVIASPAEDVDSPGPITRSQKRLELTPKLNNAKENISKKAARSKKPVETPGRIKLTPQKAKRTPTQRVKSLKEQITELGDIEPCNSSRSLEMIHQPATKKKDGSDVQVTRKRNGPKKNISPQDSTLERQGTESPAVSTDKPQLISSIEKEISNVPLIKKRGGSKQNTSLLSSDQLLDKECAETSAVTTNQPQLNPGTEKYDTLNIQYFPKRGRPRKKPLLKNEISGSSTLDVTLSEAEQIIQPDTSKRARPSRTATRKPIIRDCVSPLPKKLKAASKYVSRGNKPSAASLKYSIPTFMPRAPIKPSGTASALFHLVHNGPLQDKAVCLSNQYLAPDEALPYMDSTDLAPNIFSLPGSWGETEPVKLTPGQAAKGSAILLNTGLNVLAMEYSPCGQYLAVGGSFLDQKVVLSSAAPWSIPNGVQLWRLRGETPELAMVICHSFGPVTSLSWLPSGVNEDAPFIGLLAFASTSGKANIVQVPKPHAPIAFLNLDASPLLIATLEIPNAPLHCLKWAPATHPACLVVGSNHGSMAGYSLLKPLSDHLSGCKVDFTPRFFCQSHRGILQWVDFCIRSDGQGDLVILSSASDGNLMYLDWNNPRRTIRMLNMKVAPSPAQALLPVGSDDGLYSLGFFTANNCMVFNQRKKFPLDFSTCRTKMGLIEDDYLLCSAASPLHCIMAAGFQKGLVKLIAVSKHKDKMYKAVKTHLSISYDPAFPRTVTIDDWQCAIPKELPTMKNVYISTAPHGHFVPARAPRNVAWNPTPDHRYELSVSTASGAIFVSSFYETPA